MECSPKTVSLDACRRFLAPVAAWLLRAGITWKEFAEVSQMAFVESAGREFGLRGRLANVSRVALLTGLSRREVRRQRALLDSRPAETDSWNPASRLLSGWHQDPDFLENGKPAVLAASGPRSMEALLRRYAGDIPHGALLKELQRAGAVVETVDGRFAVLKRYFMPLSIDPAATQRTGSVLEDLATTLDHNLSRRPDQPTRFEGRVTNLRVAASALAEFHSFLEKEGQAFLEKIDDWLSRRETRAGDGQDFIRLGAGVYAIMDSIHRDDGELS
jgi:hypothetical protein